MSTHKLGQKWMPEEWISQAQAAKLRGVTRQAISKLVRQGRLRTLEVAGRILVFRKDVVVFQKLPVGRPKKAAK